MKALRLSGSPAAPVLGLEEIAAPSPGDDEVLIRVYAAAVTPTELGWYPTIHTRDGGPRSGAVPGHEFSGIVAATGPSVSGLDAGAPVFGMNDWFADGASAEYCLAVPNQLAHKPASLSHAAAATVPISALTAWQGLFDRARLQHGERVLIHGGGGAVGLFAIQLAHRAGAHVIATASASSHALLRELGADELIDYRATRFEDVVTSVDVVFDTVGGETLSRSWPLLLDADRLVTIASESERDPRAQRAFFIVESHRAQLEQVAALLDRDELKTFVKNIYPLQNAAEAYTARSTGYGKNVVSICAEDLDPSPNEAQ
jgi:NADPH:quinone reductase-like Zn-dependent oxidoreductase